MKLRLITLLLWLFPLVGMAQTLPSLRPSQAPGATPLVDQLLALDATGQPQLAHGAPVLPIWSGSSGQLLALVALPRGWVDSPIQNTPAYAGPSAWHLAGTNASGGGVEWQFGNGLRAEALLGQYSAAASMPCNVGDCSTALASSWPRSTMTGVLGLGWTSADAGLDLSYGLSWLQSQRRGIGLNDWALDGNTIPVFSLPGAENYSLDSETALYARGRWHVTQGSALDLSASYGRGHLSSIGLPLIGDASAGGASLAPGIDLDRLSLSLGLDVGSLRGAIIGHVLSSDDPALAGKRWTTLDLGVSWRTPWSGELSVGAQNLWSKPIHSPRDVEGQARTPYIQYRQDL